MKPTSKQPPSINIAERSAFKAWKIVKKHRKTTEDHEVYRCDACEALVLLLRRFFAEPGQKTYEGDVAARAAQEWGE